jgi:acyl-[acyl-carrier-protein]-phospholipid O-acyltransferase/long-chain-fatty-acid--[acyl-carrier-protein] ligase
MVVEEAINKLLGEAASVVTAVPDEHRGEKLIAFYSRNGMAVDELWEKLNDSDLPKLWIPKRDNIYCVDSIPVLGSGKIDLKSVKQLALQMTRSKT